ncbi:peptidoglycan recognition protein [Streptomyces sp. P17]|uniref:peptidoglycan recognition protein family protein n=1 Tax=Streptomyces sp. P17 TaxID=3074716 RepID=UPI0028F41312|nr:peptidoglycan recognition protein [Streptomyces sp. P17]MDT9700709.1 peptidoglycan recognition protein [Streptomyces sp. P17]
MRGFLASSIGVICAATLLLPLAPSSAAATKRPAPTAEAATTPRERSTPGHTESLPLATLPTTRATPTAPEQGLPRRDVRPFSLVGVIWDDPGTELHGRVQVRTRATATGTWSGWQDIETRNAEHGADPDTAERTSGRVRGSTAPLWVGDSDGVEVRVRADQGRDPYANPLPTGLRLELVDPGGAGEEPPQPATRAAAPPDAPANTMTAETAAASAANAELAPVGAMEIPELTSEQTRDELFALRGTELTEEQKAKPYIGPRPRIVTRRGWGANESLREKKFVYTKKVKAAFVHHTASGNGYTCSQAPSVIRGIYRYHVLSMGWRDIGYNFVVDKCGNIYEGRAGGVAKPVLGAHTLGFNTHSMGIALLGSHGSTKPSGAAVKAVARLTAWKLGLFGANPRGKTYLKSGGGNLYAKGRNVRLNVISGHRDGFATECPGWQMYRKLGTARTTAARLQGR